MVNCIYKSYLSRNRFSGELCGKYCDHESFWYCAFRVVETCVFGISTVMLHSTGKKKEPLGPLLRGCVELLLDFVVCRFLVSTNLVKEDLPFSLQKAL